VSDSTLSGNSAHGGYGGGIYNRGTLTVTGSTLSGNSTDTFHSNGIDGGGIYNGGTLTVTGSTLSGNSTRYRGGGIETSGARPVTLTNVTLTANRVYYITFGGGGVYVSSGSPVLLHNTLIAGNFNGATGAAPDDVHGALN